MIRVRLIDHVVLRTADVRRMVRFYSNVLGCAVERELPPETGLVQLRAGQSLIDIVDVESELGRAGGPPFDCPLPDMRTLFDAARWQWPDNLPLDVPHPNGLVEQGFVIVRR